MIRHTFHNETVWGLSWETWTVGRSFILDDGVSLIPVGLMIFPMRKDPMRGKRVYRIQWGAECFWWIITLIDQIKRERKDSCAGQLSAAWTPGWVQGWSGHPFKPSDNGKCVPAWNKLPVPPPEKVTREAGGEASIGDIPMAELGKLLCTYSTQGRFLQKVGFIWTTQHNTA